MLHVRHARYTPQALGLLLSLENTPARPAQRCARASLNPSQTPAQRCANASQLRAANPLTRARPAHAAAPPSYIPSANVAMLSTAIKSVVCPAYRTGMLNLRVPQAERVRGCSYSFASTRAWSRLRLCAGCLLKKLHVPLAERVSGRSYQCCQHACRVTTTRARSVLASLRNVNEPSLSCGLAHCTTSGTSNKLH